MRNIIIVLTLLLALSGAAHAADGKCLDYGPAVVTLTGVIRQHADYESPMYGEPPGHLVKRNYWHLHLDHPICVNGLDEDSPESEGEKNVRQLQVIYMGDYPKGGGWIGHRVSLTGTLSHAITTHHHTRVLITADESKKLP